MAQITLTEIQMDRLYLDQFAGNEDASDGCQLQRLFDFSLPNTLIVFVEELDCDEGYVRVIKGADCVDMEDPVH